jgi:hypothetical protein
VTYPCRPRGRNQQRRVVLATPIAESSITIDGVTAVVDSGLCRAPRYDSATGISRLVTQRIALDSAEQRQGRAGRTQAGATIWTRLTSVRKSVSVWRTMEGFAIPILSCLTQNIPHIAVEAIGVPLPPTPPCRCVLQAVGC